MSNYNPYTSAREEAIECIRLRAMDFRTSANLIPHERVQDNLMAVAEELDNIANMAEAFAENHE